MRRFLSFSILAFFAFLVAAPKIAFAEGGIKWTNYPQGVPVCTASKTQQHIRMVPDTFGGALIVWEDYRYLPPIIYAQRIGKDGNRLWGQDGMAVAVSTPSCKQLNPVVVGDDTGGAIIAWEDYRNVLYSNIYALRISSTGVIDSNWTAGGVALNLVLENQSFPDIVDVGSNGAVITWKESDASFWAIKAQRIGLDGTLGWLAGQEIVSQGMEPREYPKIINDGTGYVIITWQDFRKANSDIYAQKLKIENGMIPVGWEVNGSSVTLAALDQKNPQIASDGLGGAIITWTDYRNGSSDSDIYAQRISSDGQPVWMTNGTPICKADGIQANPVTINDLILGDITGAIIAWEDRRNGDSDIYAVKVGTDIPSLQSGNEKLMAGWIGDQVAPRMVSDNQGGGVIAWKEKDLFTDSYKIFASKRNQDGDPVWINPQVQVCQASIISEHQMVSDNSGGVIIAWVAQRTAGDYNIYAQRVGDEAQLPSSSISGIVLRFTDLINIIDKVIETIRGITGVEVEALKDNKLVSSDITFDGYYELTGLQSGPSYEVRATWSANDIVTSVSIESKAPNNLLWFILEVDYILGEIGGIVNGVENKCIAGLSSLKSKRRSGSGLQKMLSPGNGIAFVELEQRGKVMVKVPLEMDGSYIIQNLLPGRFIARAYNGTIYSKPRTVNLKEGETLKVNFVFGIMPGETVFNYPNPAKSGLTTIRYYCGYSDPEGEIKIYDIAGELVRKVGDSEIDKSRASENTYSFLWDCENSSGKDVASGVYIYIVEVKEKSSGETKKVVKKMAIIR
jgi:hypothetical protein